MTRFVSHLSIVLTLILAGAAHAQWVQTSGPLGGGSAVLLSVGADIYAGTFLAGIFKSTDGGATWEQKNSGLGYQTIVAMARCGQYILASGTEGFYRSSDGGDSWTLIPGFDDLGGVNTIATQGTHAIAGTSYGGVYVSADTGATWAPSNSGLPVTVDDLSVPSSAAAGSDYFVFAASFDSSDVYRSTDMGATWTRAGSGLPPADIFNVLYYDGSTLFAAGTDVHKSTDMGAGWTPASSGIPSYSAIRAFTSTGSNLFASGLNGMFTTTDNGANWTPVTGGLPLMEMRCLGVLGTDLFAGTISNGVYKSTDGGATWSPVNSGIRARAMTGLTVDGSVLYGSGAGVFRTTDDGNTWTEVRGNLNDSASAPKLVYASGDTLFVTEGNIYNSLSRSMDGGVTWTRVWPELYNIGMVQNIARTATGYLTAAGSIYHSTDGGNSWSTVDSAGTAGGYLFSVERLNGALFAFGQRVFKSTDEGSTWTDVSPFPGFFTQVDVMTAVGSTIFAGDRYAGMIYSSASADSTWDVVPSPATGGTIDQLHGSGTTLFACSDFLGVFRSTNHGTTWTDITPTLPPDEPVYRVAVHNGYLFAGTGGNSVWRRPMSEITTVDDLKEGLPTKTTLMQNYPNPFNPATTIRYALTEAGLVSLRVFNILGQQVAELVDAEQGAGYREVTFDAAGLPGGIYFYRLRVNGYHEERKMMLLK